MYSGEPSPTAETKILYLHRARWELNENQAKLIESLTELMRARKMKVVLRKSWWVSRIQIFFFRIKFQGREKHSCKLVAKYQWFNYPLSCISCTRAPLMHQASVLQPTACSDLCALIYWTTPYISLPLLSGFIALAALQKITFYQGWTHTKAAYHANLLCDSFSISDVWNGHL